MEKNINLERKFTFGEIIKQFFCYHRYGNEIKGWTETPKGPREMIMNYCRIRICEKCDKRKVISEQSHIIYNPERRKELEKLIEGAPERVIKEDEIIRIAGKYNENEI